MKPDERELERLFRATYPRVTAYCLRRADEATAADAVADVYAVAWRRRRRIPADQEDAALWLLAVARRVLANQARGRRRWTRLLLRVAQQADPPPADHDDDHGHDLRAALGALSESDQEILRLAYWDDLSHSEIAAVLGISTGAVATRLHRARERLRPRLAQTPLTKEKHRADR